MSSSDIASPSLAITLFGPIQVRVQGRLLTELRSRKVLWVLALLILRHDRPVAREWIAGTLWPDMDQSQAYANLRPILSALRQALGEQGTRIQSPDRLTLLLDLTDTEVDLLAYDAAVKNGTLSDLERAVALYQGSLLEICHEAWILPERELREQNCLMALLKLGEAALATRNSETAVGYYQRAASLDPWSDTARRGWMEALAQSGDSNAAMQVYRKYVDILHSDPNGSPDQQTTALYQRLRQEARQQVNALPAIAKAPANVPTVTGYLPHPLTDLVGREDERLEVALRLRRSRLMTLTGLGGIGKTRLAIEVAGETVQAYPDGVWLVALESVTRDPLVLQQIASILGLKGAHSQTLLKNVTQHLREKRLLLVLDNCEHLLEASVQIVVSLLQKCPGIRILTTSREALGITGEASWAVPALATPNPPYLPTSSSTLVRVLLGYESVQLFVERAQAIQKNFTLTESNASAVAQICSQLEGIPLAIELAAARVKALTVEQIALRLDNHLALLTSGSRTAISRQQTLRATLDWSYALLSEPERLTLRRLSVFTGGWTLEAAEAVCVENGLAARQVLDLLTTLVDRSLVAYEDREQQAGGRYRLLEMVRQYASERLKASGEASAVGARHSNWVLALAQEADRHFSQADQGAWIHRLDKEHSNLRAALDRCGTEDIAMGLQIAVTLTRFWYIRGYYSEGREYLRQILEREQMQSMTTMRAKALKLSPGSNAV